MSVVVMKKLTVVALRKDKDRLYDELVKSRAIELKKVDELNNCQTFDDTQQKDNFLSLLSRIENVTEYIKSETEAYNKHQKYLKGFKAVEIPKNSFSRPLTELSYSQFIEGYANNDSYVDILNNVERNREIRTACLQEINKIKQQLNALKIYADMQYPTNYYQDTESTVVSLGTMPLTAVASLEKLLQNYDLVTVEQLNRDSDSVLVVAVAHISQKAFLQELSVLGFVKTPFKLDILPSQYIEQLNAKCSELQLQALLCQEQVAQCAKYIQHFKVLSDYIELQYKKALADSDLQQTSDTFVLEGYYPMSSEDMLMERLKSVSDCMVVRCEQLSDNDDAPTLMKNNKVVTNFEQVTNMYTPPKYREVDPNPVMSIFYFIIFGMMVADIGYGFVLALAGLIIRFAVKQDTGIRRMFSLFGICGVSAMAVGALYGSAFSYTLYTGILPDASKFPTTTMVIALLLGIVHIVCGILLKMANDLREKDYVGAFLVSFMWVLFFAGLFAFVLQPALEFMDYPQFNSVKLPAIVSQIGMYTMIGALIIVVIFAGHNSKGIGGKLVAGFSSVYGILNYFGDIMSYIRIFGLMLSSAMMGVVINDMSMMIAKSGAVGIVLSALLLVFAHLFNLAIGILGVYIHDGRLQYVEFFGKFYQGDGRLFVPFGSDMKHTLITDK